MAIAVGVTGGVFFFEAEIAPSTVAGETIPSADEMRSSVVEDSFLLVLKKLLFQKSQCFKFMQIKIAIFEDRIFSKTYIYQPFYIANFPTKCKNKTILYILMRN